MRTVIALLRARIGLFASIFLICLSVAPAAANDELLAGFRKYYAGDREGAQQMLERLAAARPAELGPRLGLLQILFRRMEEERALLPEFERRMEVFLKEAEARYDRSAQDAEARFYLANAYMLRAQYRVNHDKGMWGAARDGARAKRLIDAHVKQHPGHGDAYFTLGLYNYYVDIAPAFVRVMRLFLFLPRGNRAEGLKQLERAHREGSLFAFPAGLVLMEVYSTYERRSADAIRIGERLLSEYPDNPDVHMQLAEVYSNPAVEDYGRAAQQYELVMKRELARTGVPRTVKHRARLGLAAMRQQQWRLDDAIAAVTTGVEEGPAEPEWAMPSFLLRRGNYRALLDDPGASDDARRVRADARWKNFHKSADDQLAWIERRRTSGEARVYAALVPGNRLVAERRWEEAAVSYEKVRQQHPNDVQVRYRIAYLQFARGDAAGAAREFNTLAFQKDAPSWIRAQSLLYVARAHDLAGRRNDAVKAYERILDDYERESAAYRARIGLVTPYQRSGT